MKNWRDYVENVLIAVLLALLVRTFILTGYKVPTGSMAPTLLPGDFIFAYRLPYGLKIPFSNHKVATSLPERGDVVVFSYPEQPQISYVKRVIGLPGDRIQIEKGKLILNGETLKYEASTQVLPDTIDPDLFQMVQEKHVEEASEKPRLLIVAKSPKTQNFGPLIVPPNHIFLLGDNRDSSDDSRYWGTVPMERVDGRVTWIWLSLNWQQKVWENRIPTIRWHRTWTGI